MPSPVRGPVGFVGSLGSAALAVAIGLVTPRASVAAFHQLSDGQAFSSVRVDAGRRPALTPDGGRVVYCQNADGASQFELWSVPLAGGAPDLLSSSTHLGSDPCTFLITPSGATVVYRALQGAPAVYRLYVAPVDGSAAPTPLTASLPANGSVGRFLLSPNGARVVYLADGEADERFDLYSVPIGGGAAVRLHPVPVANGDADATFAVAPDSSRVAFRGDLEVDEVFELYSAPVAGGAPAVKLNGALASGGDVAAAIAVTPDSSRAVYLADQQTNDRIELWSVPLPGGGSVKVNGPLVANGNVFQTFRIDPTSTTAVYVADQEADARTELFAAPLAGGGGSVKLNDPLVAGGDVEIEFLLTPDGARAVYVADQIADGRYELFSAPLGGGGATRINHVLPQFSSVQFDPLVTPDGQTAVYGVRYGSGLGSVDLFSASITGASPTPLFPAPAQGQWEALRPALAAGGSHAFYEFKSDPIQLPATESVLLRAPLPGGAPLPVSPTIDLEAFEFFTFYAPAADARQALFVHSPDGLVSELFVGDVCLLCDGFDSGGTGRWSSSTP